MMIPRKQNTKESDWLRAIDDIENIVSYDYLSSLAKSTIAQIRECTRNKKSAYSWSGGKDSIVLSDLCEKAGIHDCVFVYCNLEYTAFMNWVKQNKPQNCEMVNTGQDIEWLSKHPYMLFPQSSVIAGKWFKLVQHRGQEIYYKKHNLDMIILGRRKADGNYVGKGGNIYTNAHGITRYSPLSEWKHEDILAYIHYNNLQLPPIYNWKNGYVCGTHNWAARQWTGSEENGWAEVYEIEPSIVREASEYFDGAKEFLKWEGQRRI